MPGTTPVKGAIASPVLSPQTLQLLNPELTVMVKEQLRVTCMRLFNTDQSPITANTPTLPPTIVEPVTAAMTELPSEVAPVEDGDQTMIIPASPPLLAAPQESSHTPSLEGSPPLIGSPCKQPLTSTQDLDANNCSCEEKGPPSKSIATSSCHAEETVDLTADMKELQPDTVESSSPRSIALPSNLTACSNQHDLLSDVDEVTPGRGRLSRKRKAKQPPVNVRHSAKRQHGKQQVCARDRGRNYSFGGLARHWLLRLFICYYQSTFFVEEK